MAKEQEIKADERYQSCKQSIESCKDLVEFLFSRTFSTLDQMEKAGHVDFLSKHERIAVHHIHALQEIRREFTTLLHADQSPSRLKVQDIAHRYLKGTLDQAKCRNRIFKREYTLGNRLAGDARVFLKETVSSIKSNIKGSTLNTIARMYSLAKRVSGQSVPEPAGTSVQELESALDEMEAILERRRSQFEALEKVLDFIEKVLEKMEQERNAAEKAEKEPNGKTRRMAFSTRRRGR